MDKELLSELLGRPHFRFALLGALAGLLIGWLVAKLQALRLARRAVVLAAEERERDTEARDVRKTLFLLQNENTKLSTFLMTMPDLARQLNSNVEKRKIPQLLISFVEGLFEAEQILIFLTAADGKHLTLSAAKGLRDAARQHEMIPFGQGRIGWVAWHQITMDEGDFNQKSRVSKTDLTGDRTPTFRTELCAPMVSNEKTLGVISIGGLLQRPKNEKNMLKMVADIGSIAIQNKLLITTIQASADTDGLTILANKRHFMNRLADEIMKAGKDTRSLSLFMFDIDHFKNYNDTNGHLAGDEALRITGRLLTELVRQEDFPARYGGEEFVVLLPNTDKQGASIVAEKIRKAIEEFDYPQRRSQPSGRVTISGGIATFPEDGESSAELIRCADQALYKGKRAGRNRVCLHEQKFLSEETGAVEVPKIPDTQEM